MDAHAHPELDRLTLANRQRGERGTTRHVALGADALAGVAPWLSQAFGASGYLLIADPNTWGAAGERVETQLQSAGLAVERLILEPHPGEADVVCADDVIDALRQRLASAPELIPLAVGAGTVNDIAKMASAQVEREFVVVPTAASMNGYTSSIAAVLQKGVKRTLPAQQPIAIFADTEVVARAPSWLNEAGFGDLLSKPYSTADWLLSHLIRDVPYSTGPGELVERAFSRLVAHAKEVGRAAPEGIDVLMETLLLSGFSMALAGSSAPASGGEHLISHYWDMEQHCRHEPLFALHGTQVGIATLLSARLYERLLALTPDDIDPDAATARRPAPRSLDEVAPLHPRLTPPVVEEVYAQLSAKELHGEALRAEIARVRERWPEIQAQVGALFIPVATTDKALADAGCTRFAEGIGVSDERLVHTLRVCRQMRSRYVALDLIDDLGLLEGWAAEVAREGR